MQSMKFNIIFESFGLDPDPKLTEGRTRNNQFRIRNTDLTWCVMGSRRGDVGVKVLLCVCDSGAKILCLDNNQKVSFENHTLHCTPFKWEAQRRLLFNAVC